MRYDTIRCDTMRYDTIHDTMRYDAEFGVGVGEQLPTGGNKEKDKGKRKRRSGYEGRMRFASEVCA